jgi:hypothetical protein
MSECDKKGQGEDTSGLRSIKPFSKIVWSAITILNRNGVKMRMKDIHPVFIDENKGT